jgi:hypothetical protein
VEVAFDSEMRTAVLDGWAQIQFKNHLGSIWVCRSGSKWNRCVLQPPAVLGSPRAC